jgi:hypothetical protein
MRIYFRKYDAGRYGIMRSASLLEYIRQSTMEKTYAEIQRVLKEKFESVSVEFEIIRNLGNYFAFNFNGSEDEDYFLLWSSDGIEI